MIGKLRATVIDCRDPRALAAFYCGVLGGTLHEEDDTWVVLTDTMGRRLAFQLSPEHEPPQFPDPRGSQQFHLDIAVDDVDAAEREVLGLGATRVTGAAEDNLFRVYRARPVTPSVSCGESPISKSDGSLTKDVAHPAKWYPGNVAAPGFIAIGSGPAGVSAAETFRVKHPAIPVRILTVDLALPYAKPPLSKGFLRGREEKRDLHSAGWFVRNNVDLVRGITVDHIDVAGQEVVTAGGQRYPYWHLVVASGATSVALDVPGGDAALTLRSYSDAVALKMAAHYADSAVVVGGGLIGCEAAACIAGRGVATAVVAAEAVPLQRRFGIEAGERVEKILSDNGVGFVSETAVTEIGDDGVVLDDGTVVETDLVVAATGVRPDIRLAESAGLETRDGRIVVDEHMHSSTRNVYAAGDVALAHNVTAGRRIRAEHWRDAAHEGRVAGLTAAGFSAAWDQVPGFSCTIGDSVLKYRGWGSYEDCRLVDHHNGFTVWYETDGEVVGVLTLNADEDHVRAEELLRAHAGAG